jgi:hypothetical protein
MLDRCVLSGNSAIAGGAIENAGSMILQNSTIGGNSAASGGAISSYGAMTLNHVTISGNSSDSGGGVRSQGGFVIENSIIAGNDAPLPGSDVLIAGGTISLAGINFFGDPSADPKHSLKGTPLAGINFFGDPSGSGLPAGAGLLTGNPLLAPLIHYGGRTATMPPLPSSPTIDAAGPTGFATDQRGAPRSDGLPDIGAVEFQPAVVTTASDQNDSPEGPELSLREALARQFVSTITFAPVLSGQTITLANGELVIDKSLTIDASALPGGLTIDANGAVTNHRVMEIPPEKTVHLDSLTLTGGKAGTGGAVYNDHGYLTLTSCTLIGNSATFGGGIDNEHATVRMSSCTLSGNSATHNGGGIYNWANPREFGVSNSAWLTLANSIVAANSSGTGPDIYSGGDVDAVVTPAGINLIGDLTGTSLSTGPAVLVAANLMLAALSDYGGPTATMPPLPGSPAIDAAGLTDLTTDQRGMPRVVDGNGSGTAIADIGSVETLRRANLDGFDLTGYDLSNIDLSGATLTGTNLTTNDLSTTNLCGARYNLSTRFPLGFDLAGSCLLGLLTQGELATLHAASVATGEGNVTSDPAGFGLYDEDNVQDLAFGRPLFGRDPETDDFVFHFKLEQSPNLSSPWTPLGDLDVNPGRRRGAPCPGLGWFAPLGLWERPCGSDRLDPDEFEQRLEAVDGGLPAGSFTDGNEKALLQQNAGKARGGVRRNAGVFGEAAVAEDGIGEDVVERGDGFGGVKQLGEATFHFLVKVAGAFGDLEVLEGLLFHGTEEEDAPVFPCAEGGDFAHVVNVVRLVLLEEAADVEVGGGNGTKLPEQQGDKHAPDTAVAVLEGVERLEFQMADRHAEQCGPLVVACEVEQLIQPAFQLFGGNRHEADLRAAMGADVVLLGFELPGVLGLAAGE